MARVRASESFSGLLACMGAGQEADFDDETAARMAAEGYPVEIMAPEAAESNPAPGGAASRKGGDADGGDDRSDGDAGGAASGA